MSGHMGLNATMTKLKQRFFWPGLRMFIIRKIAAWLPCLKKSKSVPSLEHQQYHEYSSYFGQRLCIDTVGPLNKTKYMGKLVCHILTMQDSFTRYLVAVPVPDLETKTLAKHLLDYWVMVHGCPEQVHSDRGTSFTSELFIEVMRLLNIRKTVTPPYCPRGDRVERAHRVLGELLRADGSETASDWANKLPATVLAYNIAVNRMTGTSPFEAVFGRRPTLPVDFIFPVDQGPSQSLAQFLETRRFQLAATVQHMIASEAKAIHLDPRFRPKEVVNPLEPDQLVYMFTTRLQPKVSAKLQTPWIGPFKVLRTPTLSLVEVQPVGTWCKNSRIVTVTVDRLVRVDETTLMTSDLHPDAPRDLEEDELIGDQDELDVVVPSYPGDFVPASDIPGPETFSPPDVLNPDVKDEVAVEIDDEELDDPTQGIPP